MICISQTGMDSLETYQKKKSLLSLIETGEESDEHLLSVKSEDWVQVFASGWQEHCSNLQQKKKNGKGVFGRRKERRGKLYWRQLCWQQREVVYQAQPETSPEVRLSQLGWQIALLEQNNLKVSFDICVRFMTSQFASVSERPTGSSSVSWMDPAPVLSLVKGKFSPTMMNAFTWSGVLLNVSC